MAIAKGFAFSIGAKGKIGKNVIGQTLGEKTIVRNYCVPGGSPSALQVQSRQLMKDCQTALRLAAADDDIRSKQWEYSAQKAKPKNTPTGLLMQSAKLTTSIPLKIANKKAVRLKCYLGKKVVYAESMKVYLEKGIWSRIVYDIVPGNAWNLELNVWGMTSGTEIEDCGYFYAKIPEEMIYDEGWRLEAKYDAFELQIMLTQNGKWQTVYPLVRKGVDFF